MTIQLTQDELEWCIKETFNWHIKEGCPQNIYKTLKQKLDILNKKTYSYEYGIKND